MIRKGVVLGYLAFLGLCQLISKSLLFRLLSKPHLALHAILIQHHLINLHERDVLSTLQFITYPADQGRYPRLGLLSVLDQHLLVDEIVLEDLIPGGNNALLVRGGDEVLEEVDVFHPGLLDLFRSSSGITIHRTQRR